MVKSATPQQPIKNPPARQGEYGGSQTGIFSLNEYRA
jgi:hypothetical protein